MHIHTYTHTRTHTNTHTHSNTHANTHTLTGLNTYSADIDDPLSGDHAKLTRQLELAKICVRVQSQVRVGALTPFAGTQCMFPPFSHLLHLWPTRTYALSPDP